MTYLRKEGRTITYPYGIDDLKRDFPQTSFPAEINDDLLEEFKVYKVHHTDPVKSLPLSKFTELKPERVDDKYYRRFSEIALTEEEVSIAKNEELQNVRKRRNQLLKDCDFTMLEDFPDKTIKTTEWKKYRQDLRDVTKQEDVFNIIWPVKPE